MKVVRRLCLVVAGIVLLAVAGALVPRPLFPVPDAGAATRRILVLVNPIHTDIALPVDAVSRERFAALASSGLPIDHPGARYLVFGWGSRAFYIETPTWSDLKPGPLLAALTLDASVMHVSVAGGFDTADSSVRGFDITDADFDRLMDFIAGSFGDGPVAISGAGYGDADRFFEAKGRFNALLGCNTWAAAALRAAGLRTGWWNPLPQTLGLSLDLLNPDQSLSAGGVQP
ncbi:MAG: TIGR02117 family protein [Hyphomicrobiales bacterium]|nr:TIGR02117 family protein [Hyphomicrobiales bacterium]